MLAAHFLRVGALAPVVLLIAIIPLLGLRRWWVPRMYQVILCLGALEWLRTLWTIRELRVMRGEPHARMVAILAGVALLSAAAAALFEVPPVRRWYRRQPAE